MAIFEQIESRIIVDKKHLLEYDYNEQNDNDLDSSPDDESTIIEKYVESRPGKNFEVELQLYPGFHFNRIFNALSCDVFVDGNRVGDRLLMQKDYSRRKKNPLKRSLSGIEAYRAGKEELQKFKFKHLESRMLPQSVSSFHTDSPRLRSADQEDFVAEGSSCGHNPDPGL